MGWSDGCADLTGALIVTSKSFYVMYARRKIKKLRALNLPENEFREKLEDTGGTSQASAVFGTIITAVMVALPFVSSSLPDLPECQNSEVAETIRGIIVQNPQIGISDPKMIDLSNFKQIVEHTNKDRTVCALDAKLNGESVPLFIAMSWEDRDLGRYETRLAGAIEGLDLDK
ncbi:hypothetical protein RYZ26_13135 [Terasakiella sp. A23]|uniref:hypothetical protein n=1 Tax=Terasakiella sp. FCG-A23 TaxID=3080561 RepID=UPI002952C250|nr:hypothetical protein [Terasakiella sp. A23]MDV7340543.1 hypothetical protein [Terasakiella sp. A23]